MNELKATAGPWFADRDGRIWRRHPDELYENGGGVAGDRPIASAHVGWYGEDVQGYPADANAALIAAAPEIDKSLLTMCNLWVSVCNAQGWAPDHVVQYGEALAALKKARGE